MPLRQGPSETTLEKKWNKWRQKPAVLRAEWWGLWTLLGVVLLLLANGQYRALGTGSAGLFAGLCFVLLLGLLLRRMWPGQPGADDGLPDRHLATGAVQLVLGFALAQGLGGLWGEAAVVRYALVAAVIGFHRGLRLLGLSVLTLLCEGLFRYAAGQHTPTEILGSLVILGLFMGLREAVFRGELLRQQIEHKQRLRDALLDIERQAEQFRLNLTEDSLVAATTEWTDHGSTGQATVVHTDRVEAEMRLLQSAVVMVRQNMDALVGLLRQALGLSTCAVLWESHDGESLEVVAASTDAPLPLLRTVQPSAGLLGSVRKTRSPLHVTAPKLAQLSYYDRSDRQGDSQVRCVAAIVLPLFEEGALSGVLCVDRLATGDKEAAPFSPREEAALKTAVPVILRSVQSERVFRSVERGRDASRRLASASGQLTSALRPEEVQQSALSAVAKLCAYDFAALTEYDDNAKRHTVLSVSGDAAICAQVSGLRFSDNKGLCSSVVHRQTILPVGGILRDQGADTQIFDETTRLRGYKWLLALPLSLHHKPRGTLVVAGRGEPAVPERQALLKVLANQIAVSLDNARMYQAVESLATTDGLTGLFNRRTFQLRIEEMRERAHRQGRTLSLILCDIDHFKKINDTRGHLVGDEVLRQIAKLLAETVRKVDLAARYGGEEFAILLEATEEDGAFLLAERIRQEAERLTLHSDKGTFFCTLSLGIATFPGDGTTTLELIAHADAALYAAKHQGRNRVVRFRTISEAEQPAA